RAMFHHGVGRRPFALLLRGQLLMPSDDFGLMLAHGLELRDQALVDHLVGLLHREALLLHETAKRILAVHAFGLLPQHLDGVADLEPAIDGLVECSHGLPSDFEGRQFGATVGAVILLVVEVIDCGGSLLGHMVCSGFDENWSTIYFPLTYVNEDYNPRIIF